MRAALICFSEWCSINNIKLAIKKVFSALFFSNDFLPNSHNDSRHISRK